jgi:hypothetical protein
MAIREKNIGETPPPPERPEASQANVISELRRALENYRDTVHQAWRHEDASHRVHQILQSTLSSGQHAPDYATYLEEQAALARKLQDAWIPPEFHETVRRGFAEYVQATKAAFAALDPLTVTPAELAHIAHLIAQAASLIAVPINRTGGSVNPPA